MKYNIVLFGVKTETYSIYKKFEDKIDLVVALNEDEQSNYHISGKLDCNSYDKVTFLSDSYKLDSKLCDSFFEENEFEILES